LLAADKLKQGQKLSFLKRRAWLVFHTGKFFETKRFAFGATYVHAVSDFGSAQSRRADTLCRNAKPSH
jgi:hypothetical protein